MFYSFLSVVKEKAKLKRAKERARQKALLKKQQIHNAENSALTAEESTSSEVTAASSGTIYSSNSDQRLAYVAFCILKILIDSLRRDGKNLGQK